MNTKALTHWFENEMEVEYEQHGEKMHEDGYFIVYTDEFSADDLGEIRACKAGVRWNEEKEAYEVFDDEEQLFG